MVNNCKILSPVGSMDVLKSAVFSGADCVYLSGKMYGARDFADNFTHDEIKDAVEFCHNFNVKVYVTVNISILEKEIIDVIDYVYFLYSHGVDAVIIQDIGLGNIIHKLIPRLELHASTQMTIYDYTFVKWLYDNGYSNCNISREVSIGTISSIIKRLKKYDYDMNEDIPKNLKYCIISVVKEAVSNIIKHSNATEVSIIRREHPAFYQMLIEDNGSSVNAAADSSGIGLIGMRERIASFNGTIDISKRNSGFRIFIHIPKAKNGGNDEIHRSS